MRQNFGKGQKGIIKPLGTNKYMYLRIDTASEIQIIELLRSAKDENNVALFESVTRHLSGSPEKGYGLDITVRRNISGNLKEVSFGVTTSSKGFASAKVEHPNVRVFYTPLGFNHRKFLHAVLRLF